MSEELKPCPFCGCKKIIAAIVPTAAICARCNATIVRKSTKSAISAWNMRK